MTEHSKLPRLFVEGDLRTGLAVVLNEGQTHYLRNVMRRAEGDRLRLFNGRDGEWLGALTLPGRKNAAAVPEHLHRPQGPGTDETHLIFAPLKKDAMDAVIRQATELGVTHLHPVVTQHTETRRLNAERARAHIIEAAEQCERLTLPALLPLTPLGALLEKWPVEIPVFAALERADAPLLRAEPGPRVAYLVGPEGGFMSGEKDGLAALPFIRPVTLGAAILRAETAALFCLSVRRIGLGGA